MGDYLRDVWWDQRKKPNVVIAGDWPGNHSYNAYVLLFKDGHAVIHEGSGVPPDRAPVTGVKGAYYRADCMYRDDNAGDPAADSSKLTWLEIAD